MIAIVTMPHHDGTYPEVGMERRSVTGEYKTFRNLIRFGIPAHFKGRIRLELFNDIHGEPFKTIYVNR